jgi:hypothetical protein
LDTIADYAAWKARRQQIEVAKTQLLLNSIEAKPDEVAGDLNLAAEFSKTTGNPKPPLPLVREYRNVFQQRLEAARTGTILSSSPRLTEWLQNPENAYVARDSLPELAWWENGLIVPRGVASALPALNEGFYGLAAAVAGLPGKNPVSDFLSQQAIASRELKDRIAGPTGGWLGRQVQGASQSVGMMLPGIAASIASGGVATPALTAAYILPGAVAQGGHSAQVALDKGRSSSRALMYGTLDATAEAVFSLLPVGRLLGDIERGTGFGRMLARQIAAEVPSEVATTLYQNLNAYATLTPEKPFGQFLSEQPEAIRDTIAQTVLATAGVVGSARGVQSVLGKYQADAAEAANAEGRKAFFQELSGQATMSKLRERMPDKFRQFVEQATAGGPVENVYVPAGEFVQYFQGIGIDPRAVIDEMEGVTRDDLDAALAGGGDLQIPTATYAAKIAGSEHDAFLMENMRFDPDQMTAREAAEFNARAEEALEEAWRVAEDLRQHEEEFQSLEQWVREEMAARLRLAGRASDVANTEATLYQAFYRVMAERSGLSVEEFLQRYPLPDVLGSIPEGMQPRDVDALNRTLAEARARRTVREKRPSLLEFIAAYGGIDDRGGELKSRDAEAIRRPGKRTLRLARSGDRTGSMFGERRNPAGVRPHACI